MKQKLFVKATPIWLKGLSEEMNIQAGFRAVFKARRGTHTLRIAGATIYRITLNGKFLGHGPARCGHGYYRVDEWELPVSAGDNLIAVEVAGYNANSYAYLDQPSFLQAEVVTGDRILAATGARSFSAYRIKSRVQRTQRYSYQRPFSEVYKLTASTADWASKLRYTKKADMIDILAGRQLVPRGVPYPKFETRQPVAVTSTGTLRQCKHPKLSWSREWGGKLENFKAFPANKGTVFPLHELQSLTSTVRSCKRRAYRVEDALSLKRNAFSVLDLGCNLTGFIGLHVECDEPVDLYLSFDELAMDNGDVSLTRYHCCNVVKFSLKPGVYDLETIEPYTLRYLKLLSVQGSCRVTDVFLREYASPDAYNGSFACSDQRLNDLFEAARQTFRQNSVDIFMDCPGRERAGWLCDSFFTARAERDLCGNSDIERNFFENYVLPKRYPFIAKGMLPMCYPSDHTNGVFIPSWAMFFVIELEEYLNRSGDRAMVDALKDRVYGLLGYFKQFLNEDGLLEKLEKWVFVEWSDANRFTEGVNYPNNMVYAGMLDAAGALYDDPALIKQAKRVRGEIQKQSFDGDFFVDNAIRKEDGHLEATRNRSETCQYYAFFFDVASPKSHPKLWKRLLTKFGPDRDPQKQFRQIRPSNAFIGFFLRLDVLSRYGRKDLVLDQLYKTYLPMVRRTGTLWEHNDTSASCNHGFASHVAHILYRDVLGLRVDPASKEVEFDVPDLDLEWCEGVIPIGNESVRAKWSRRGREIATSVTVPRGYRRATGKN